MKDAFGVSRETVSKIVVRTPTRLVRMMADGLPRHAENVSRLTSQMNSPQGFVNPVSVGFTRSHHLTPDGARQLRALGKKDRTRLPTPKLVNGHHRLQAAEGSGQRTMLVDWRIRPRTDGNALEQGPTGEWIFSKPYGGIPKDRTKEVIGGAAVLTAAGAGGGVYAHQRRKRK